MSISKPIAICAAIVWLTVTGLAPAAAFAQSARPAIFVCHNIATAPQFNNYAAVTSFAVGIDGEITYVGDFFTNDYPQAIDVSPNGRFLAVTHASSSTTTEDLLVFRIESDASLTMWAVYPTPDSPLSVRWISNDAVACTETKTSGMNRVHVYRFTETNPVPTRLTLIDSEDIGVFSAYLSVHPSRKFLYASDSSLNGSVLKVRTFSVETDGGLTFAGDLTFVGDTNTSSYPLDMIVTNDGSKLYAAGGIGLLSGGDPHRIHGFSIPESGLCELLPGSPFISPNNSPAHVAVTGDDQILLVGHGSDGDIRSFFISPEDGFLTDTGNVISIGGQGDIGAIAAVGNSLFATRRYSSTNNPSGLLQYRINSDGSFVQIGELINTNGPASDAIAVWVPPSVTPADINADGAVDQLDVDAFVAALLGQPLAPEHLIRSDLNGDSSADGRDVEPFVVSFLSPDIDGACCNPDGTCVITDEVGCAFGVPGSTWLGVGSECSECPDPAPVITEVFGPGIPTCNSSGWQVFISVVGSHFTQTTQVVLRQDGQPDIHPDFINYTGTDFIDASFPVQGVNPGDWFVVVINPDGQSVSWPIPIEIIFCP